MDDPITIGRPRHDNPPFHLCQSSLRNTGETVGFRSRALWSEGGKRTRRQDTGFFGVAPAAPEALPVSLA